MKVEITLFVLLFFSSTGSVNSQLNSDISIAAKLGDKWAQYKFDEEITAPNDLAKLKKFIKIVVGKKEVLICGTWHKVYDPGHPMYEMMDSLIRVFNPTLFLTENYRTIYSSRDEAIQFSGDVGYTLFKAHKMGVQGRSWDALFFAYNQIVREFGADSSLLMVLNVLDFYGEGIELNANNYGGGINLLMYQGVAITSAQTQYEYYKRIFEKSFGEPLLTENDSLFRKQRVRVLRNKKISTMAARFMALRDLHLIKTIKNELKEHDRIFVQVGAFHTITTKDILESVLVEQSTGKRQRLGYEMEAEVNNNIVKLADYKDGFQVHIYPITNAKDSLGIQREKIASYIRNLKPDMVLTEQNASLFWSKDQTIDKSGLPGFVRYIATENKISFMLWPPSWNRVYYRFSNCYTSMELYNTIMGNDVLENLELISDSVNFLDLFFRVSMMKFFDGYPFKPYEANLSYFMSNVISNSVRKMAYSVPEIVPLIKKQINYSLLNSIKKWRIVSFFDRLYELRQGNCKRVIMFMDSASLPYVKEYVLREFKVKSIN